MIIKTNSKKAARLGFFCVIGSVGSAFWLFRILLGEDTVVGKLVLGTIFLAVGLAILAVHFIGIAVRRPTALRMDEAGISGYYVPRLDWHQIAEVAIFKDYPNNGFVYVRRIGIRLADPDAFMKGQTLWQRLNMRYLARKNGFHIAIRPILGQEVSFEGIVREAKKFQAAATEQAGMN